MGKPGWMGTAATGDCGPYEAEPEIECLGEWKCPYCDEEAKPGDLMTWTHTPRGGYGYSYSVDAVVVKVNKSTIRIEVTTKDGRKVQRNVRPSSLRARNAQHTEKVSSE